MKKEVIVSLCCLSLITLSGCSSSSSQLTNDTLEDGTTVIHAEDGDTYDMKSLNGIMTYEGSEFCLRNISFYEDTANYERDLWTILEFDMSKMDEESLHWLINDDTNFHVLFSVDNEQNSFDSEYGSLRASILYDNQTLMMAFVISDYRYSLAGSEYDLSVSFLNGGTYTPEDSINELDKEDTYYFLNYTIPEDLQSSETMNKTYYNDIIDAINNRMDTMSKLFDD